MTAEWVLIYQVRWYAWIPLSLYAVIVELFMAIMGLGALGFGSTAVFVVFPMHIANTTPSWQYYGIFALALLF